MCGISAFFAVNGLNPDQTKIAQNKLKILGIFNESRGSHGCGVFMNNQIFKGYEVFGEKRKDTRLYHNFIADENWIMPPLDLENFPNVIQHSRQASVGLQVPENNHPFLIEMENPKNSIVGAHNGTIENIWQLCNERKFNHVNLHVDSKALFALMAHFGPEDILTHYKGAAALVWMKPSEPRSVYIFHGAARRTKDGDAYEERPLFYMKTNEGIFISSMAEALSAIRDDINQEIFDVEYNEIIKITNGKFTSSKKHIFREDANLVVPVKYNYSKSESVGFQNRTNVMENVNAITNSLKKTSNQPSTDFINNTISIEAETKPVRNEADADKIMFWKGRYWQGPILAHGELYLNCKGKNADKTDHNSNAYYFFAGVMLLSEEHYNKLIALQQKGDSWINQQSSNFAFCISKYAAQPVVNLSTEFVNPHPDGNSIYWKKCWYKMGHRQNENFSAKFSGRTYIIKNGFLHSITSSDSEDKVFFQEGDTIKAANFPTQRRPWDKTKEKDCSFDAIFENIRDAVGNISKLEKRALLEFCEETLKVENPLDPTLEEIAAYYMQNLQKAVTEKKPLREILGDVNNTLEMYMVMIEDDELKKAPPVGSPERSEWDEQFYARYDYYPNVSDVNFHQDILSSQCEYVDEYDKSDESLHDGSFEDADQELVEERVDLLISQLQMLEETIKEIEVYNTAMARDIFVALTSHLRVIKPELKDILKKYNCEGLIKLLNNSIKSVI